VTTWRDINAKDVVAFNALLTKNNIQSIPAGSPSLTLPVCVAPAVPSKGGGGR
jgi:hypothetical protein